eukprot:COSAG02_NODE_8825_length_2430_cov_6.219059_1_plen_180_part_10
MLGRDTGHRFQFSGGLADRLKKAAEKRGENGRCYQLPTLVGLNPRPVFSQARPQQNFPRASASKSAPKAAEQGKPPNEPTQPLQLAPEPEPELMEAPKPGSQPAAAAFAASPGGLGSIAARWNSAAPPAFWSYPWQLSSMTAQLVSFVEQTKPDQTPLERLSGAIDRALVVAKWSNGDVY